MSNNEELIDSVDSMVFGEYLNDERSLKNFRENLDRWVKEVQHRESLLKDVKVRFLEWGMFRIEEQPCNWSGRDHFILSCLHKAKTITEEEFEDKLTLRIELGL